MCIEVNAEDFNTIHHELGHNFYQRAYNRQPLLFRNSANDGIHAELETPCREGRAARFRSARRWRLCSARGAYRLRRRLRASAAGRSFAGRGRRTAVDTFHRHRRASTGRCLFAGGPSGAMSGGRSGEPCCWRETGRHRAAAGGRRRVASRVLAGPGVSPRVSGRKDADERRRLSASVRGRDGPDM
jgi:hypothetical protein